MRSVVCLSVLLLAPLSDALAQAPMALEPGQRVRITAPEMGLNKQVAKFEALEGGHLIAVADSTVSVPVASVTRIDAYAGRHNHPWRGVGIGFGLGALSGAIIGGATREGDISGRDAALISAGMCSVGGAVAGLIAGLIVKTDKWVNVPLDNLRVSIVPQREGRFALTASIGF